MSRMRAAIVALTLMVAGVAGYHFIEKWQNHIDQRQDGVVAFKNGEFERAVELLEALAEKGDAQALLLMGIAYAHGHGVGRDRKRAQDLLISAGEERAAEQFYYVALRFEKGEVVERDDKDALYWYILAAERGYPKARDVLANAYRYGQYGLSPDPAKAANWAELEPD